MARLKSIGDKQRELLAGVSREVLVDWVIAMAKELPDVKRRLDLLGARNSDAESAAATYRATLLTFTKSRNRNPQKRAREARINFENMTKSLTSDFEAGRLALVLDVVPEVLLALDGFVAEHADPQGKVRDLIPVLTGLHLDAATELRPGGERLAAQLAKVGRDGMRSGLFRDAAYTYRDVLGDEGLAVVDGARAALPVAVAHASARADVGVGSGAGVAAGSSEGDGEDPTRSGVNGGAVFGGGGELFESRR